MPDPETAGVTGATRPVEAGKLYRVVHTRKGTFVARATADAAGDADWLDFVLVEGVATAIMSYNVREAGETLRVARALCLVYGPLAETSEGEAR